MRTPLALLLALAACSPSEPATTSAPDAIPTPVAPPRPGAPLPPPTDPAPAPAAAPSRKWLDADGTSILGFGVLRVVPPAGGGSFRVRYREEAPGDYGSSDRFQLFVLPGDAFAARENAFAGDFLGFARTPKAKADGYADLTAEFRAAAETTVIVAYGPWTAVDTGRPSGDLPTFTLEVIPADAAGAFEWVESEAGELITTNWSNRPGVARGTAIKDPETGGELYVEVRPMILYDGRMVRDQAVPAHTNADLTPGIAGEQFDEAADRNAVLARSDRRIPMTRDLAEKFRRVPIRWR